MTAGGNLLLHIVHNTFIAINEGVVHAVGPGTQSAKAFTYGLGVCT